MVADVKIQPGYSSKIVGTSSASDVLSKIPFPIHPGLAALVDSLVCCYRAYEAVTDTASALTFPMALFSKVKEKPLRIVKVNVNGVERLLPKPTATPRFKEGSVFRNELVNKPIDAAIRINLFASSVSSVFEFVERVNAAGLESGIACVSQIPVLGPLVKAIAGIGFRVLSAAFLLLATAFRAIKDIRYILLAKTDATKDAKKGWLNVLSRVIEIAYVVFALISHMPFVVVALVGAATYAINFALSSYRNHRHVAKERDQNGYLENGVKINGLRQLYREQEASEGQTLP